LLCCASIKLEQPMRIAILLSSAMLLSLSVVSAMGQTTLAGTSWVMASAGKRPPSISFEADGKVAGSGGCNRFFGNYEQNGESLSFSPLGATRMACPTGIMKIEHGFFAMLGAVRKAKLEASTLVLIDAAGKELARLSRRSGQ
jgi:heat shock protein HslJ